MRKLLISFLSTAVFFSIAVIPNGGAAAQVITLPAEVNKAFSPLSIAPGGVSRLSVTVYNPNLFPLTNTSWTDNLVGVQPGLRIADPVGVTNNCGGSVSANAGSTTLSLSGGTVPAQTGSTPGRCTVTINVTSNTVGNLINTIPSRALSASGGGTTISNTDPASATLNVAGVATGTPPPTQPPPSLPPVALSKSISPGTIWAGGVSQLTIEIRNNQTNASLTQASVTDNLPANVFVADPASASLSGCGNSASVTAVSGGTSVTLNNGTIAPGSTCTIRVNVTSTVQGTYTNRIPAGSLRTQEGLSNPRDATDRLIVQAIGITKAFSPGTISAGGTSTLTITLQNPTNSPYTGVSFTDDLPSPLTVTSVSQNTCGGTLTTTPANTIRLTGGVIPAGSPASPGTCTIAVQVSAPADATSGNLTNTIPANNLTTDQGVSNPRPATDRVTVRGTDITASKSFSDNTINVGEHSRLRIDIIAPGDTNLTNFSIRDDLPPGVTISNSTPPSMSGCGDTAILTANTGESTISLTNGLILAGQRCRIQVYVTGSVAGTYTNTIPRTNITNSENRLPPNDLTANLTINTPTQPPPPGNLAMALVKGFEPKEVFGGSASTMSIELINLGDVALTGITFTDNMPDNMILANPVNFNVGTCGGTLNGAPGESTFTFSGGNLPPFGRCTLTLSATMTVNGNLTNTIPAGAVITDQGVITNPDPAAASLTNLPGASISKYFTPNSIPADSYALLTITIQNTGNIPLTGLGFSDSLPAGLTIAGDSAPAAVNNCGGTLVAVPGTQLIELNGGALTGNASCTIVTPITGSNPGAYQNTIPAGNLRTDPNLRVTNSSPATDTLIINGNNPPPGDGGGGGGGGGNRNPTATPVVTSPFLIPVTGFAPGRLTHLDVASRMEYSSTSLMLEVPVLKVKAPIVGVESNQGEWDVSWLQHQVGWLHGSAYPGWKGNSVLTAHVVNADGKAGTFSRLKALGVGEYVFVYNGGYRYTYKVVSNTLVQPTDSSVMRHEEKSYLTLITCDTYDEKTGTYLKRVAVRAVLIDIRLVE
ncbi:MAG TPA: sortase [Anaerolineales bacterium]|nr:sortase [Anaerolineales bacterium]